MFVTCVSIASAGGSVAGVSVAGVSVAAGVESMLVLAAVDEVSSVAAGASVVCAVSTTQHQP